MKYTVAFESSKVYGVCYPYALRSRLHQRLWSGGLFFELGTRARFNSRSSELHERATARGLDDPCKADYSRFLKTVKKKQRSAVIPLEHGP